MKLSKDGIRLIAGHEGFRAEPYVCAGGKLTIGYGHVIKPDEILTLTSVTHEQAQALLARDVEVAELAIRQNVTAPLNQSMFDALVSFIFNVGTGNFKKSSLLNYLNQELYQLAALEFCKWNMASMVRLQGLINRRAEEQLLFTIGAVKAGYIF